MEEELDLVTFTDEDGNEFTMEVLDYFFYEGKEYALLAEVEEGRLRMRRVRSRRRRMRLWL